MTSLLIASWTAACSDDAARTELDSVELSTAADGGIPPTDGGLAVPDAALTLPDGGSLASDGEPASDLTTLAEFRGTVDVAAGTMRVEVLEGDAVTDAGLRRAQQGLCTLSIVQDGVPGSGPPNSIELVTGTTGLDAACDGYLSSPLFCGAVTVRSFYATPQTQIFAQISSLSPSTGFGVQNGDVVPGASSGLGSWAYGDLGAASSAPDNAGVRNWVFARSGGNFTFTGRVVANVTELCDGLDNDCDGVTDEGNGCRNQGENCTATVDCSGTLVCTGGICSPAGCPSGQHLEAGSCVSDTRSCSITNGTGSQAYAAGSWSACAVVGCNAGYHQEADVCVSDVRTCTAADATAASETWTGTAWGVCTASACLPTHHVDAGVCQSNIESCPVANGNGTRTYIAGAWSSCTLTSCDAGFHVQSGACVSDTRTCTLADGTGSQTWQGSAWGSCTPTSCDAGYHVESGACASDSRNCLLSGGAGDQNWNGSSWNGCVASACYMGFTLQDGGCVAAGCGNGLVEAGEGCDDGNLVPTDGCTATCTVATCGDGLVQAGVEACDDGNTVTEECNYGAASCTVCTAACASAAGETDLCGDGILDASEVCDDGNAVDGDGCSSTCVCGAGYHVEGGLCVSDVRTCVASNATAAFESWTGSAYGACTASACVASYHVENSACASDTRACSVANATTATQSWTGADYTACAATGCAVGYSLLAGACVAAGCGNSVVEAGEACDDGNTVATDSCTSTCTVAACGDGVVQAGVDGCDDGNTVTEECSYGAASCTVCSATCTSVTGETDICGDGILDSAEACDDGNTVNGDSCSDGCVCGTGFHLEGGVCTSDTRSCLLANGTGTEQWNGSSYGSTCSVATCNSGYHIAANSCAADVVSCSLANATAATQTWNSGSSSYGSCTATACEAAHHLENGTCAADVRVCSLDNGTATESWNGTSFGPCTPVSCNTGYHVESGACMSNSRSCSLVNATVATETWTGSGYGACTATACAASYHVQSGACVSDARSCSAINATAASETWNGSTFGPCTPTECVRATKVSAGGNHACVVLDSGSVQCWGAAGYGQIGTGATSWSGSPITVLGVSKAADVSAGDLHTCALLTTGGLQCWGQGGYGQLGDYNFASHPFPSQVWNTPNATGIDSSDASGSGTFLGHTCSVLATGAVSCWGNNFAGQLGTGQWGGAQPAPVAVVGIGNATSVSAGYAHSCARLSTGEIKCWGAGNDCQLGSNPCGSWNVPVIVTGLANATSVSAGAWHTCAVLTSGEVKCWGHNGSGTLGDGTTVSSGVPVTANGISTATQVSAGFRHTCAVLTSGEVKCWGGNEFGQLGNGSVSPSLVPVTVSGISNATQISVGVGHSCARLATGKIKCWGDGDEGQLGNGSATGSRFATTAFGYHIEGGACATDNRACSLANATAATQTWSSTAGEYGACEATACEASYHIESGACVSDIRVCSLANATAATQTWSSVAGDYGACAATACAGSYHIESGTCVSDIRLCATLPVNTTAGTQTWTGSAYGTCTASACASGYWANAGACVLQSTLGTACTLDAECASGFCATGPTGTANDRCAPTGMNYIPAGIFTMGAPADEVGRDTNETQHSVTLSRSFFIGQTEVTQGQWKALSGGINPSYFQSPTGTTQSTTNANDSGPAEYLDWYAAAAFANAKSAAEGLSACYTLTGCTDGANGWKDGIHSGCTGATFVGLTCTGYRLPTESEWEYAARAGTTTATYGGNLSGVSGCVTLSGTGSFAAGTALGSLAWYNCNAGSRTQAVGSKTANSFGLSDMLGNVSEWTGDWYGTYPAAVTDPTGPATGVGLVMRGGTSNGFASSVRAARRSLAYPDFRFANHGFRLSRTVPAPLGASCTANAECASGFCATGPTGTANDRCAPTGMNYIPAGTFTMGSPSTEVGRYTSETQHSVTVSRSFFLGQTEVTQGQWKALSGGTNPSCFQSTTGTACTTSNANDNGPVEWFDWYSALAFANARSAAEGLTSCYTLTGCTDAANGWQDGIHSGCMDATFLGLTCTGYRLPTESEWEYAARGGTTAATYLGNLSGTVTDCSTAQANLDGIAWWCRNSGSRTQAVAGKTANSFGLYDMLGNVLEWTGDWYGTYPGTVTDPTGATTGSYRVYRGGSWARTARQERAAYHDGAQPFNKTALGELGLRLARTAP